MSNRWIPVSKGMPPADRGILLIDQGGEIFTGYLCLISEEFKNDVGAPCYIDVTHWMPLPPPPEDTE